MFSSLLSVEENIRRTSQMKAAPEKVTLIGAGLNGPLLAILLAKRGFAVEIYERRPDMRRVRMSAGRSINLALSTRGIHALQQAGLWERMRSIIIPMKGRMMHSTGGELTFQPYGKNEAEVINSISRAELNIALINCGGGTRSNDSFQSALHGIRLEDRRDAIAQRGNGRRRLRGRRRL